MKRVRRLHSFSVFTPLRPLLAIAILVISSSSFQALAYLPGSVRVCEDAGEWPPFLMRARTPTETMEAEGPSVDIARRLFKRLDLDFTVRLLPWKRTLAETERGEECDMILNASFKASRVPTLQYGREYYYVRPHYFFRSNRWEGPIRITSLADLREHRVGGILGYNYSYAQLTDEEVISSGIYDFERLIVRLRSGEFDLFIENIEVIHGYLRSRPGGIAKGLYGISHAPLPDVRGTGFHMVYSRSERGMALYQALDPLLGEMIDNGEVAQILQHALNGD